MFTMHEKSTRRAVSAVAAVAIVSFSGLVLDQAHIASAPRGIVEIGELTLVNEAEIASMMLPEVVVVAKRESPANTFFAATTELPEIVVTAKRVAQVVVKGGKAGQDKSSLNTDAKSALLK